MAIVTTLIAVGINHNSDSVQNRIVTLRNDGLQCRSLIIERHHDLVIDPPLDTPQPVTS